MAEGLALAASVIAVLQITNSVISVCYDYGAAAKGASWQMSRISTELEGLRGVLERLEPLAKQAEAKPSSPGTVRGTLSMLCQPDGLLQSCLANMEELESKLKTPSWFDGFGPRRKALVQVLRWPLKESDTEKALRNIGRYKDTLNLALTTDQMSLSIEIERLLKSTNVAVVESQQGLNYIQQTTSEIRSQTNSTIAMVSEVNNRVDATVIRERRRAIRQWLAAPDPSTNYHRGRRSRQATTGSWFTESHDFRNWLRSDGAMLWLHGKPGCGKSVLASTIITKLYEACVPQSGKSFAYFFFDFNDSNKQTAERLVRSLITQLSENLTQSWAKLEMVHTSCADGHQQADVEILIDLLKSIINDSDQVYLLLDALDECTNIQDLMSLLIQMNSWKLSHLHILFTSRRLPIIEEAMEMLVESDHRINIQSQQADEDISIYVHERLRADQGMRRWRSSPDVQKLIESTLTKKADGMFRWVVCQLDTLQHCPNLPSLRKALNSLPKTLDDTYARMLSNIPEESSDSAFKVLLWLTYAMRPLEVQEMAEVIAIKTDCSPWFDSTARFPNPEDLLAICSGLVIMEDGDSGINMHSRLRLAHFSVQEYLVSDRIRQQGAARYSLKPLESNQAIASACLAYLLHTDQTTDRSLSIPEKSEDEDDDDDDDSDGLYPLHRYAEDQWTHHTRSVGWQLGEIERLCAAFLIPGHRSYQNWVRRARFGFGIPTPLYMMARERLIAIMQVLLDAGASANDRCDGLTTLWFASNNADAEMVALLIKNSAALDDESEQYGTPLQVASRFGSLQVVTALIAAGADVNHQPGIYGTALQAASDGGSLQVVKALIEAGANVNQKPGAFGTALQAATLKGNLEVVRCLIDNGADSHAWSEHLGSILTLACTVDAVPVAALLLERGTDVNARVGIYGSALQVSCTMPKTNINLIRLLIAHGAEINAQGGSYGTPLQAACSPHRELVETRAYSAFDADLHDFANYNEDVVEFLLEKGAEVNVQGGLHGTALHGACATFNWRIVHLLLQGGAATNLHAGSSGTPLHVACAAPQPRIIRLLLEAGAELDAYANLIGTPLHVLCNRTKRDYVATEDLVECARLLLKAGADVNASGGEYYTALKATLNGLPGMWQASFHLTRLLLEFGAEETGLSEEEVRKLRRIKAGKWSSSTDEDGDSDSDSDSAN